MPAIQPVRLKKQVLDLMARIDQPALFVRDLHSLLDLYTDHTQRPGQAGVPHPLISSYNTPPPVTRQVWNELQGRLQAYPDSILPLCDALWAEPNYDLKLLAVRLLGMMPTDSLDSVLDRLSLWVQTDIDRRLLDGLLKYGLGHFHEHLPAQVFTLLETWLSSSDIQLTQAGLRALIPLINLPSTEHLPTIFRLITPFIRIAPSRLRPDIVAILTALAHISPSETAYLLRQNLSTPNNPDTPWLIRQVLDEFPSEIQQGLRLAMKPPL